MKGEKKEFLLDQGQRGALESSETNNEEPWQERGNKLVAKTAEGKKENGLNQVKKQKKDQNTVTDDWAPRLNFPLVRSKGGT